MTELTFAERNLPNFFTENAEGLAFLFSILIAQSRVGMLIPFTDAALILLPDLYLFFSLLATSTCHKSEKFASSVDFFKFFLAAPPFLHRGYARRRKELFQGLSEIRLLVGLERGHPISKQHQFQINRSRRPLWSTLRSCSACLELQLWRLQSFHRTIRYFLVAFERFISVYYQLSPTIITALTESAYKPTCSLHFFTLQLISLYEAAKRHIILSSSMKILLIPESFSRL